MCKVPVIVCILQYCSCKQIQLPGATRSCLSQDPPDYLVSHLHSQLSHSAKEIITAHLTSDGSLGFAKRVTVFPQNENAATAQCISKMYLYFQPIRDAGGTLCWQDRSVRCWRRADVISVRQLTGGLGGSCHVLTVQAFQSSYYIILHVAFWSSF